MESSSGVLHTTGGETVLEPLLREVLNGNCMDLAKNTGGFLGLMNTVDPNCKEMACRSIMGRREGMLSLV